MNQLTTSTAENRLVENLTDHRRSHTFRTVVCRDLDLGGVSRGDRDPQPWSLPETALLQARLSQSWSRRALVGILLMRRRNRECRLRPTRIFLDQIRTIAWIRTSNRSAILGAAAVFG